MLAIDLKDTTIGMSYLPQNFLSTKELEDLLKVVVYLQAHREGEAVESGPYIESRYSSVMFLNHHCVFIDFPGNFYTIFTFF